MLAAEFTGTDRYAVERRLGSGGFGVVYQVLDRERGRRLALKTLHRADADALYRFKREFRALADVRHRNLVALYELHAEGDLWFFTMELVQGTDFTSYARGGRSAAFADTRPAKLAATAAAADRDEVAGPGNAIDWERARRALGQLARGVIALHAASRLHRDIKPSNVLVAPDGRVVLLDFGLVKRTTDTESTDSVGGTAAYMAPEQAAGQAVSEAADWYSVGVMLYEVLTGRRPYEGTPIQILVDKQGRDPTPPEQLAPDAPGDLCALCRALLSRAPAARPGAGEVLAQIGDSAPAELDAVASEGLFVGRGEERALLAESLALCKRERLPRAVHVGGQSGMGKSALLNAFLTDLPSEETVVLAGRCYERESVPYKAVDSLVDALCLYLRRLARVEAEALMPRDVSCLARLFPVLSRVEAVSAAPAHAVPDPQELRRRAFAALRELLARITDRRSLVLAIDDLHWGDHDSATLLRDLLRPPDAPAMLIVTCFRPQELEQSDFRSFVADDSLARTWRLELGALPLEDSTALASALVRAEAGIADADAIARSIAHEAGGNAFFIGELARHVERRAERRAAADDVDLTRMILSRVARLDEAAGALLEIVAVAGGPVDRDSAAEAAGVADPTRALESLLDAKLVRRFASALETYHDRLREAVTSSLGRDRLARRHLQLALALERAGADPEALAVHFERAGEEARAARYALEAADQAFAALAFERAARLYSVALARSEDSSQRRAILVRLGDALRNAGRGPAAAERYLEAAAGAPPQDRIELERRAVEQLLSAGLIDEGISLARAVLGAIGVGYPATPRAALASLLLLRGRLRLRGLGYRRREAPAIDPDRLFRIDTCWTISSRLANIDVVRSSYFATHQLLCALAAGEPGRVACGLAIEAGHAEAMRGPGSRRARRLIERAKALARDIGDDRALGLALTTEAIIVHLQGRFVDSIDLCRDAHQLLSDRCSGVAWELSMSWSYWLYNLFFLGRIGELADLSPAALKDAELRGNRFGARSLRGPFGVLVWLARDDLAGAREQVSELSRLPASGFQIQHYWLMWAAALVDLYAGDRQGPYERVTAQWRALSRSQMLRVRWLAFQNHALRAATAIAAAAGRPESERAQLLADAERSARRICRRIRGAIPYGELLRAGVSAVRGDRERAAESCAPLPAASTRRTWRSTRHWRAAASALSWPETRAAR